MEKVVITEIKRYPDGTEEIREYDDKGNCIRGGEW